MGATKRGGLEQVGGAASCSFSVVWSGVAQACLNRVGGARSRLATRGHAL